MAAMLGFRDFLDSNTIPKSAKPSSIFTRCMERTTSVHHLLAAVPP